MSGSDDERRFEAVFEANRQGLHAYLLAKLSDRDTANDLLQETFLRCWRRFDEIAELTAERQRAWLYTVARNLATDRYRSRATRRRTVDALAHQPQQTSSDAGDVGDAVAGRDEVARLHRLITALPDDQRTVLTMATAGGLTSQQIGQALRLPAGTVRYRLHRARATLAAGLEADDLSEDDR